ncbi:uncharacterized protein METZ01_LOCUS284762, partial [marine metagenome]
QAKSLIEAAEEHPALVQLVANGTKTLQWVAAVLEGFRGHHPAVKAIIGGADPGIAANFLELKVTKGTLDIIRKGGMPIAPVDSVINDIDKNIQRARKDFRSMNADQKKKILKDPRIRVSGPQQVKIERYGRHLDLISQLCKNSVDPALWISGPYVDEKKEPQICNDCKNTSFYRNYDEWVCRNCRHSNSSQPKVQRFSDITKPENFDIIASALSVPKSYSRKEKLDELRRMARTLKLSLMISQRNGKISRTTKYNKGSSKPAQKSDFRKS